MKWLPEEAHLETRLRLPQQENEEKRGNRRSRCYSCGLCTCRGSVRLTVFVHTGLVVFSRSLSYGV